jgi:hypothetical protein
MGYKLLTKDLRTRVGESNETQWVPGEWQEAKGIGGLCTGGVLHDYNDPWIAAVVNPAHAAIRDPVCYETERDGDVVTDGLKCGCKRMRIVREVPLSDVPVVQRVAFGILAALEVYHEPKFVEWAKKWLSGEDRSDTAVAYADSATYAYAYVHYVCADATYVYTYAARVTAALVAYAARAAAKAAYSAYADAAADAVARAVAYADAVADTHTSIDWDAVKARAITIQ